MLLDALTVLLPLGLPFLLGLPLVLLLRARAGLGPADWLLAPFVGLGALVLVLQNLVYLDVPVARATPWVWAALAASWLAALRAPGTRASLHAVCPRAALVLALAAWALQSAALVKVGPRHWVGRLWEDQYGYTSMAQFFRDEPYSTEVQDLGQRAFLFRVLRPSLGRFALPLSLKQNRIGQSMLQAFLAASLGRDAKPVFGPLVVLGAPLLALALVLLAGRLGLPPPLALLAGGLGGLMPAFTLLQVEGFLSHALVLGFFPAWLYALDELGERASLANLALATLVLAFGLSDYCEMSAAFAALGLVVLLARGLERRQPLVALRSWGLVCLLALALNPGFVPMLFLFSQIATTEEMHTAIYPWAYAWEGLARLWLGDLGQSGAPALAAAASLAGAALCALGLLGLLLLLRREARRPSRALALGTLALALGALPLRLTGQHPYQFYKTLVTGAPALALGLVALSACVTLPRLQRAARALALTAALLAALATLDMVWPTAFTAPSPRSNAALLLDPDVRGLGERLESLRGDALVIGPGLRPLLNTWLAYYARGARVWVANQALGRDRLRRSRDAQALIDLSRAPRDALVLTQHAAGPAPAPGALTVWSNPGFTLWRPAAGDWALLFDCDGQGPGAFTLLPQGSLLRVLAGRAGRVRLELRRQDERGDGVLAWRVGSDGGAQRGRLGIAAHATAVLELRVEPGFNELLLQLVEGPGLQLAPARVDWLSEGSGR